MRKVIDINNWNYEARGVLENILNVKQLPRFIIIETVEEED